MHYIGALTHYHHVLSRQMMSTVRHDVGNNIYYNITLQQVEQIEQVLQ